MLRGAEIRPGMTVQIAWGQDGWPMSFAVEVDDGNEDEVRRYVPEAAPAGAGNVTDDERRRVAAELRSETATYLAENRLVNDMPHRLARIIDAHWTGSGPQLSDLFPRLAELIEPADGFDLDTVQRVCFECMEGCDEPEWTLYTSIYDAITRYKRGEAGVTTL